MHQSGPAVPLWVGEGGGEVLVGYFFLIFCPEIGHWSTPGHHVVAFSVPFMGKDNKFVITHVKGGRKCDGRSTERTVTETMTRLSLTRINFHQNEGKARNEEIDR